MNKLQIVRKLVLGKFLFISMLYAYPQLPGTPYIVPVEQVSIVTFTNAHNNIDLYTVDRIIGKNEKATISYPDGVDLNIHYKATAPGSYPAYTSPDIPIPKEYTLNEVGGYSFYYSYPAGYIDSSGGGYFLITIKTKLNGSPAAWTAKPVKNQRGINENIAYAPLVFNGISTSQKIGINVHGEER